LLILSILTNLQRFRPRNGGDAAMRNVSRRSFRRSLDSENYRFRRNARSPIGYNCTGAKPG